MAEGSCYLFLGPELGEKKDAIGALRAKLKAVAGSDPEVTSFYAGENDVSEIVSFALNGSLFADARLVLVKNADQIKKNEARAVCDYIEAPCDNTVFILISDMTKIEPDIEKAVEKYFKPNKKIFWELFEEHKTRYVRRLFSEFGFQIEDDAVTLILELVENNTDSLRRECSKIAVFLRDEGEKTITEEKIEKLLAHSKEETVFSLFTAICRGDFQRAAAVSHALLAAQTAPQAMFGFLAPAFRKFRSYCALARAGNDSDFELKKAGITALGKKDYGSARRIYGDTAPEIMLSLTAEYDIATRSLSHLAPVLTDMYLYKIFSLRREPVYNSHKR